MNINKKLLLLGKSLFFMSLWSALFSFGLHLMFDINFWGSFIIATILQIIAPLAYNKYVVVNSLKSSLEEYNKKPYKQYRIPLTCQSCGSNEDIDVDLNNTTYKCSNCHRTNAIYVSFTTAVVFDSNE